MSRMEGVEKRCTKHGKEKRLVRLVHKGSEFDCESLPIKVWYCPKCHDIKMREDE